jgi:hypothetical protein
MSCEWISSGRKGKLFVLLQCFRDSFKEITYAAARPVFLNEDYMDDKGKTQANSPAMSLIKCSVDS